MTALAREHDTFALVRDMLKHFRTKVEAHIRLGVCSMVAEEAATPA